jgi:hypothetical protein
MPRLPTHDLSRSASQPHRRNWVAALVLGLGVAAVCMANGRNLGTYDTAPATMMLVTIARWEGVYLDGFRPIIYDTNRDLPIYVKHWRGHVLSRYPTAPPS